MVEASLKGFEAMLPMRQLPPGFLDRMVEASLKGEAVYLAVDAEVDSSTGWSRPH